jgi:hypothetical protein
LYIIIGFIVYLMSSNLYLFNINNITTLSLLVSSLILFLLHNISIKSYSFLTS